MAQVVRCSQHFFFNQTHSRVIAALSLKVNHTLNRLDLLCNPHRREACPKSMTSKQLEHQSTVDALSFVSDIRSTFSGGRAIAIDGDGVGRG